MPASVIRCCRLEVDRRKRMPLSMSISKGAQRIAHCHTGMLKQGGGFLYNMEGFGSNGRTRDGISVYGMSKAAVISHQVVV